MRAEDRTSVGLGGTVSTQSSDQSRAEGPSKAKPTTGRLTLWEQSNTRTTTRRPPSSVARKRTSIQHDGIDGNPTDSAPHKIEDMTGMEPLFEMVTVMRPRQCRISTDPLLRVEPPDPQQDPQHNTRFTKHSSYFLAYIAPLAQRSPNVSRSIVSQDIRRSLYGNHTCPSAAFTRHETLCLLQPSPLAHVSSTQTDTLC